MKPLAAVDRHLPWIAALAAGAAYSLTLAPTVGHTDAGELAAAAYNLGVAHPTGYPLFTLLGWLCARIPIGAVAWRLDVMCLLFVVGGVFFWTSFLRELFRRELPTSNPGAAAGAIVGAAILCFGRTWWAQATGTEVYSLQCLLTALALWALLRAWHAPEGRATARWAAFGTALALCFANHLSAIALLPGALYMYLARSGLGPRSLARGLLLAAIGAGVLAILYGTLPVLARAHPAYAWGAPLDWTRLLYHVSGRQFSVYMFQGADAFAANLREYAARLPAELGWEGPAAAVPAWIGLGAVSLLGMAHAFRRARHWAIFFTAGFACNLFWAASYTIKDPEPYFLLSLMAIAFAAATFTRAVWALRERFAPAATAILAVALAGELAGNFGAVDQRGLWQYADYARAALESLPPRALVLSKTWDVFDGPAMYLQGCEGVRPDVTVIDFTLLRDRHWYPARVRALDPALAAALGDRLDAWERAVWDFDIRRVVDVTILRPRFGAVYAGVLEQRDRRPVFVDAELRSGLARGDVPPLPPGVALVPDAFLFRVVAKADGDAYRPATLPTAEIRFGGDPAEYENALLVRKIAAVWDARAKYEDHFGRMEAAAAWRERAEAIRRHAPREAK